MKHLRKKQPKNNSEQLKTQGSKKSEYLTLIDKSTFHMPQRKCVYIKYELVDIISRLVTANPESKITIGSYISTIIEEHLRTYREDIEHFYKENTSKTLM